MNKKNQDIIIIGAGLCGLTLAYLLKKEQINAYILEARPRIGGRIFTKVNASNTALDMGATWLGKKHTALTDLLQSLDISTFKQILGKRAIYEPMSLSPHQLVELPPNNDPSYRIQNGSSSVIQALSKPLSKDQLHLETHVVRIEDREDHLEVFTNHKSFTAAKVISTLPPYLFSKTIELDWSNSREMEKLTNNTHTWMGDSIKIGLSFDRAFWRTPELSGTIFSNAGPIPEMYDHANYESSTFGLIGFLNGSYYSITKEERLEMILKQLEKYYGSIVRSFTSYEELVWTKEPFTYAPYSSHILPHQNNGHPLFKKPLLNGKLLISGSETASTFPGYMDGAVESAHYAFKQIMKTQSAI